MRNAFIEELVLLAEQHPHIALVVGDLGFSVIEPFADRFPDRFINAGVAEQNMTGLAAGMASEGYHVFTYSIANFPTFRCAEQLRNDVDYQKLPVTVVAVGGGLAYGALGYSHHAVQDYALLRLLPSTLIASPGDPMEVRACLRYLVSHPQPSYLRLGKAGEPSFHAEVPQLSPGQWVPIRAGGGGEKPLSLLTTGAVLGDTMAWAHSPELAHAAVLSCPLWGMGCKPAQVAQAREAGRLVTIEDHLVDGGFGSWLNEALASASPSVPRSRSIGLDSLVCGLVGTQPSLNRLGGLRLDRVLHEALVAGD
jgi:transketolase